MKKTGKLKKNGYLTMIMKRLHTFLMMFTLILMLSLQSTVLHADEIAYQEHASEIILNSLQSEEKHSFLRKAYKQLLFTPVWMHEKGLSSAAKELFDYIAHDETLDIQGDLYRDSLTLHRMAQDLYARGGDIYDKVNLEFNITQLYKEYVDYSFFGSINWGAFQARIANLMVNDVSTEWVLHRPGVYPAKILEQAAFGSSLKKMFDALQPTAYHYKALQHYLVKYMKIKEAGGWEPIWLSQKLTPGKRDRGVYTLRERLRATGDYVACDESEESGSPRDLLPTSRAPWMRSFRTRVVFGSWYRFLDVQPRLNLNISR